MTTDTKKRMSSNFPRSMQLKKLRVRMHAFLQLHNALLQPQKKSHIFSIPTYYAIGNLDYRQYGAMQLKGFATALRSLFLINNGSRTRPLHLPE